MERESLGSRLGFILLSAGCAIGVGNVWKFPYLTGECGGGVFVLIYLIFLVLLGIPVMSMEFSVGRGAQKSPVKMFHVLEKPGTKWHIFGIVCYLGPVILIMYYTTVAGWMLQYFFRTISGQFAEKDAVAVTGVYEKMLSEPVLLVASMGFVLFVGAYICSMGLQNGLERVTKVMMILLLAIMLILAVNSVFLKDAGRGLAFYLIPDFERMKEVGIKRVIVTAMNQAFFTLSVGIGTMAVFGSYIDKDRALFGESVNVVLLDTFVAIVSGLVIIPACFAYGVEPQQGPGLIFVTLPIVFNHMRLGRIWGSLFFVFMTFAAFSTVLAVLENIIANTMDLMGWTRKKTCMILAVCLFVFSLPCALGFNVLSWIQPLGESTTIMDLEDAFVSRIMLPIGSLVFVMFCTHRWGWGWDHFIGECDTGKGMKFPRGLRFYMTYILPVIILALFIIGILP